MSKMRIYENGDRRWVNEDGILHRVDGPAVEYADGGKEWWVNGMLHRLGGPAVEYVNGHKEWYLDGERHRVDGPAVEIADGCKMWWVNGVRVDIDELVVRVNSPEYVPSGLEVVILRELI